MSLFTIKSENVKANPEISSFHKVVGHREPDTKATDGCLETTVSWSYTSSQDPS